jgi:hypothetical protein
VHDDLKEIPSIYSAEIDSVDTICGVEKLAGTGRTANYTQKDMGMSWSVG